MSCDLPDGWMQTTLGAIATLGGGTTPSKSDEGYWSEGSIPWATPSDITALANGAHRISATQTAVTDRALKECSLPLNPPGTVLMTSRATIGFVALNDVPMVTNQGFINFRCSDRADPEFLLQWIVANRELLVAAAGGSTFKELTRGTAKLLPIALPPLDEQRRISEVLRSIDEAVISNEVAEKHLFDVVKQTMVAALHLQGESRASDSGWQIGRIGDLGKVQAGRQRGPSFTNGRKRPYLRVANVFDGTIKTSDVLEMPFTEREYEEYRLIRGDILLNEGQSIELVGRAAMYLGEPEDCCFQNTLIRFRALSVPASFAHALIRTLYWTGRLSAIASQTTSVAHLGVARFASLEVAVPPPDEQHKIGELFEGLCATLDSHHKANQRLKTLRRAISADLLSGRVRVPA